MNIYEEAVKPLRYQEQAIRDCLPMKSITSKKGKQDGLKDK